ncbi:MAG: sirohydrochlorin chelatase [Proteobacteria bacterium]|nr:sirohydrochlorin chelatase [Pseudomonadota bacterium]
MNEPAVMICGHGSRDLDAIREFDAMVAALRARLPGREVGSGFLEFATPIIREGLDALKAKGATHIHAVPAMLFAAGHVKNDLPWELNTWAAENPGIKVEFGRDLAIDLKLIEAAKQRIEEAEAKAKKPATREDTLLVVVGRGTNDPDANSNVAKVARMLWEGMGFGWATVAYSGVAHPRTNACLARAVRLGFRRIVVFPYFLFNGILIKRIYDQTDEVAALNADVEFLKADYLGTHPKVIEAFLERLGEIGAGKTDMNCLVCKYRTQIVGYEADVGAVQAGHHLHVRGIGTDGDPSHGHDHGHHHHDHHHHDHDHAHGHAHAHPHKHR